MTIKERMKSFADIYISKNLNFYFSVSGSIFMFVIHLISLIDGFSYYVFNYCIFSFAMFLVKTFLFIIGKSDDNLSYKTGIIAMFVLIHPMLSSVMYTFLDNTPTEYFLSWFPIAYAVFATVKITCAIIIKKKSTKKSNYRRTLTWINLVSAFYTVQMMEFALIYFVEGNDLSIDMRRIEVFTLIGLIIFSIYVIFRLAYNDTKVNRKNTNETKE